MTLLEDARLQLAPFKAMTEVLSAEKYPSANLIISQIPGLHDELGETAPHLKTQERRELYDGLMGGIRARLYQYETNPTTGGATFFDTRMKKCGFRQECNFDEARNHIQTELQHLVGENRQQEEAVEVSAVEDPPPHEGPPLQQVPALLNVVRQGVLACRSSATAASTAIAAVRQYIQRKPRWENDPIPYCRPRQLEHSVPARPGAALCGTGAFPFPSHFPLRVATVAAAAYVTETAPAPLTNPFRMGHKFFNVSHASNMNRRGSDLVSVS